MTPSKILFYFCISFIVGIFLASIFGIPQYFIWGFLFLGAVIVFVSLVNQIFSRLNPSADGAHFPQKNLLPRALVFGFCILFLVLGILRMQISEFNIFTDELSKFNDSGKDLTIEGVISDEPDIRDASQRLKVKIGGDLIMITTNRYPEYHYLDRLKIIGKPEAPFETEDFSYKKYLMKDGIYSVMGFPKIELIGQESPNIAQKVYSEILSIKKNLRVSIQKNFSPPESLILQGIILGDKTTIPKDLKTKFSVTGTSHIIAVSGTHIVILGAILMSLLFAFGFSRGQAFYVSIIFICFYIILVGLPASGIRSGIMGILYLAGQNVGRQATGSRIIVLACATMLLQNPLLLLYDIGFQLSYLAVLGLIYFEPIIRNFLNFLIKKVFNYKIEEKQEGILMLASVTFAAQIFTLPIIIFNFGTVSWVYPITNILILPIVYYLMLFGFLSVLAGVVSTTLGWILSLPCYFLLLYFIWVVNLFSQPWMVKYIENVSWIWLLLGYSVILAFTVFINRKYSQKIV